MRKFSAIVLLVSLFTMLLSAPASANKTTSLAGDFIDIENHWAYDQMSQLIAAGILTGYKYTAWDQDLGENVEMRVAKPYQSISRAEFAALLFQALNLSAASGSTPFTDAIPAWAEGAVNALYNAGIVKGNPDGTFKPNANITRAEIVTMLVQALNDKEDASGKSFPDVSASHWAYENIQKATALGIVNGMPDGTFAPQRNAQRGEVMVMLYQFMMNDKTQAPTDKTLLKRTDAFLEEMEENINGNGTIDLSSTLDYLTGEQELVLPSGEEVLNNLKENGSLTYEVAYPGKVVAKSDWLAEVVYETEATFEADGTTLVQKAKEHYYLMKMGDKWYIYSSYDEDNQ